MTELRPNRIRKIFIPGAFFFLASIAVSIHSMGAEILLTPPGLRPIRDPFLVIPAGYRYSNRLIELPVYRVASGNPASGWSAKFVDTRRFASDQSAWIFFRNSDLRRSVSRGKKGDPKTFRFWPVGTVIVIESYKGNAFQKKNNMLMEIAVMSKTIANKHSSVKTFYPVNWSYARFTPDGNPSFTSAKVRQCHQCHSIAFHLTGDLIFTHFP